MPLERDLLHVLGRLHGRLDEDTSLEAIASNAGWSPFHLHRVFSRVVGETPKRYALRIRLETAAARLVAGDESVCDVAVAAGFNSHEVFTRAFRRHFGQTPSRYRATALQGVSGDVRERHRSLVDSAAPCVGLFHTTIHTPHRRHTMPTLSIDRRELAEQPIVFVRMRAARHEIAGAIGEGLGKAFPYSQRSGAAIAGRPFTRYLSTGPGLFEIEVGIPLTAPAAGEDDVKAGALPGGLAAVGLHAGPYDQLTETYAAMERWIEANGLRTAGAPWESYITDPAEHPDPGDWRTEVFWPVAAAST
jgi:AraC family transcriptional regulator